MASARIDAETKADGRRVEESVKGVGRSGSRRDEKEAGDRAGRAGRCIIVTFTLGQVRSIVMDKLCTVESSERAEDLLSVCCVVLRSRAPALRLFAKARRAASF